MEEGGGKVVVDRQEVVAAAKGVMERSYMLYNSIVLHQGCLIKTLLALTIPPVDPLPAAGAGRRGLA